jgi:hypothetical protein
MAAGSYKTIRLLTHIKDRCSVERNQLEDAVVAWLSEDVHEQAHRLVHHAWEGYKRTDTNGESRKRRER